MLGNFMLDDFQFHIVLVMAEFYIASAASLKAKRSVITRIRERIRSRFNVSIAEVGYQDKWQRAAFAMTLINMDKKVLQKDLAAMENLMRELPDVSVTNITVEWL